MARNESVLVTASFTTTGGKALAMQSAMTIIQDTSRGALSWYQEGVHNIEVIPGSTIIIALYAPGGGGGASAYAPANESIHGGHGGNITMTCGASTIVAGGGKGGTGGEWSNGSSFTDGTPGKGGLVNLSGNLGDFEVITYANGADAVLGSQWAAQPIAIGTTNEADASNDGGQGALGVGDDYLSFGGSGGAGSYVRVRVTNTTELSAYVGITVGNAGTAGVGSIDGGAGRRGSAVVIR